MEAVRFFFYLTCIGILLSVFINSLDGKEIGGKYHTKGHIDRLIAKF